MAVVTGYSFATPLEVLYLTLAVCGAFGFGSLFVQKFPVIQLLIGLTLIAALIQPFVFYAAGAVRPLAILLLTIGQIALVIRLYRYVVAQNRNTSELPISLYKKSDVKTSIKPLALGVLLALVVAFALWHFWPTNYAFESHDLVYFGWIPDLWGAALATPLVVGVDWPNTMGSNHLIPGLVTFIPLSYWQSVALADLVFVRFGIILMVLFFGIFVVFRKSANAWMSALAGIVLSFGLFGGELGYEFRISSYLYLLLLLTFTYLALWNQLTPTLGVVLLSLLVLSKAPIVLVAGSALAWFVYTRRRQLSFVLLSFLFVLIVSNYAVLYFTPRGPAAQSSSFNITFLSDILSGASASDAGLKAYGEFGALVRGWCVDPMCVQFIWPVGNTAGRDALHFVIFAGVLAKIYIIYFCCRLVFMRANSPFFLGDEVRRNLWVLDVMMLASVISVLLIRNNSSVSHQSHAYLLMAGVTTVTLIRLVSLVSSKLAAVVFLTVGVAIGWLGQTVPLYRSLDKWTRTSTSAVPGGSKISQSNGDFYISESPDELPCKSQVKAALVGKRFLYPESLGSDCSQLSGFTVRTPRNAHP